MIFSMSYVSVRLTKIYSNGNKIEVKLVDIDQF